MRIAGLSILALLLVGALILLGQSGGYGSAWDRLTSDDGQQIQNFERQAAANFDVSGTDVFGAHSDSGAPIILSGLPSFASMTYRLPLDVRPVDGTYRLAFSSDVAQGVEGALRVTINGVKRGDLLLAEGTRRDTVTIELTASELSAGKLDVGISLQGRGPIAECSADDAIAAVVEVESSSGLRLQLQDPVTTSRDKLALWGDRVPVAWQNGGGNEQNLGALMNGARLSERGYTAYFSAGGMRGDELTELAGDAPAKGRNVLPAEYPIALTSLTSNQGARTFDRQTSWRYAYDASELPGGSLPRELDLQMALGPVATDRSHNLFVTVNDHVLFAREITQTSERISQTVAIPAEHHRARNNLQVSIVTGDQDDLRCGANDTSVAELLDGTVLRGGGGQAQDDLSLLRDALANASGVLLTSNVATAADASVAAQLLAELRPSRMELVTRNAPATIRVLTGDIAAARNQAAGSANNWLIYQMADRGEGVMVRRAADADDLSGSAVALLVSVRTPSGETPAQ